VKTLSKLVAQLIQRFIGKEAAQPLAGFIVDRGLGLMGLEINEEARNLAPGYALAQVTEDTVHRLAEMVEEQGLTESELEDPNLLEFFAMEAFEQAAAANLPAQYLRPEARETSAAGGTWVLLPAGGTPYYKKYTEIREITIDPVTAQSINSFGGETLGQFLASRKGATPGQAVKARIHIYQAIRDTWLSRITLYEKNVPGLGTALEHAWSQVHPLTTHAAGVLLGSAGLGKDVDSKYMQSRHVITPLQRFYYLEVIGSSPVPQPPPSRPSQFNLVLDGNKGTITLHLYLSEDDAQQMAKRFRGNQSRRIIIAALLRIATAVENTLADGLESHLIVIRKTEQFLPAIGRAVLELLKRWLKKKLKRWILKTLIKKVLGPAWDEFRAAFIAAADSSEAGLTMSLRGESPEMVNMLIDLIDGQRPDLDEGISDPSFSALLRPGFHRD
jgi:hypothetical protein